MSPAAAAYLKALRVTHPDGAEAADRLHPRMLELWAAAEVRDYRTDPRWTWLREPRWGQDAPALVRAAAGTWPERVGAVFNPYAPEAALRALRDDPLPFVAGVARVRLEQRLEPLPRPVVVHWHWSPEDYIPDAVDAQGCLEQWVGDLRWYRAEVAAGRVTREQALRYVAALPEEFRSHLLDGLEDDLPEGVEAREGDEAALLDHADRLPERPRYDYEGDWGASDLTGGLDSGLLALEEPVHPSFTDDELDEWLGLAAQVLAAQRGFSRFLSYPEGYGGLDAPALYLGFAVWYACTDSMPSYDVTLTLGPETHPALWAGRRMVAWLAELGGLYRHA